MHELLNLALLAGEIMLKNGSETYQVQKTIEQILKIKKNEINSFDILVIGTGIIITLVPKNDVPITVTRSMTKRMNNFEKISLVSKLVDKFSNGYISIKEAYIDLQLIAKKKYYSLFVIVLASCFSTSCFAMTFGSTLVEGFFTFIATIIPAFLINLSIEKEFPFFLFNMISGALIGLLSLCFLSLNWIVKIDPMIASAIIILTPGVVATTAIRDMVNGDFITGTTGGIDALIQASSLAIGVAGVFTLWYSFHGGIQWTG